MNTPLRFPLWVPALLVLLAAGTAVAQRAPDVPREMRENVELAGTLEQIGPGVLQIATAAGDKWLVRLEGRPQEMKVSFSGKADRSFLKSGMLVQFEGTVNKRGELQEKLEQIVVTSPREGIEVGIYPEAAGGNTGGLFSDDNPKEKPKKQARPDVVRCRVTGLITKIGRKGELTVNCRNGTVTAELADTVQVSVDLTDLRLAQPGDKVELRGWHVKNQKGTVWTREVSVSAAEVLGEVKKKPRGSEKAEEKKAGADKPAETSEDKPAEKASDEKKEE
ncbi:MAG TPA: hypothetical protein VMP01_19825 [Pirellulaceae bacterium]|nr:hypothetical protein [Pirellulaceae bacterium]